MKFFLGATAALLLAVTQSSAIDFTRTEIPGTGVALNLPTDWVPIPLQVIQRYKDAMASSSKSPAETRRAMNYVYGAQRKAEDYFEYPYLLIQIVDTGRFSEAQFKSLPNNSLPKGLTTAEETVEQWFPKVLQGAKFNTPTYDPTTKRLWYGFSTTVAGLGSIHALQTMIPTETGLVEVNMYCKEGDFTSLAPLFREIGSNVELSSSVAYKPRWTDDPTITSIITAFRGMDWSKVASYAILGALIPLVFGIRRWIGRALGGKGKKD
jgi:hypothetical protein